MMKYTDAQKRELDCAFLRSVMGYQARVIKTPSHLNPGKMTHVRVFMKDGLIDHFLDPSGEFKRCYRNAKDDTNGLASPVPHFSSNFALTANEVTRLGFVVWPCQPERDGGREGIMFLQHQHGIIDEEAFHMIDVKGLVFEDVAVGACVSSIMWVNGDLPATNVIGDEEEEEEEFDLS